MATSNTIKVGFCVAYDWIFLQYAIPAVYDYADVICLSVDYRRRSWSGGYYSWDEPGFRALIAQLDTAKKISVLEEDFYKSALSPMANEIVQRKRMSEYMGLSGWHVQLDADEYLIDFRGFVSFLKKFQSSRRVNICCPLINLYKVLPDGFLWIRPQKFHQVEYFPIATRFPNYQFGRRNGYFNVLTDFSMLHQCWARTEEAILEKLNNWGHSQDFDIDKYFKLWQNADSSNYKQYRNFHHLNGSIWPALELKYMSMQGDFIKHIHPKDFALPINKFCLYLANSLWVSRFKKMIQVIIPRNLFSSGASKVSR